MTRASNSAVWKGLGKIVVRATVQTEYLVLERVASRHDDHVLLAAQLLDPLEQSQPIAVGQHDVEQDAVVVVSGHAPVRLGISRGRLDHVPFLPQRTLHDLPERRLVLDDQNLHTANVRN